MDDLLKTHFVQANEVLNKVLSDPSFFEKVESAGAVMVNSLNAGGKIISCGNGGSMCDAMHFAEELTGRYRDNRKAIPAISISDPSHLACVGNDYGYDFVFSRYVEALGNEGDVLLGISTSGNSKNVIRAFEAGKAKGMKLISLTGNRGGELAARSDVEIRVPHHGYADRIQEVHIKIIHSFIDYIERHIA
ncbi:MAG: D-sedoheptulose 7-phosphate isomerase [Flavobacteriales bacterium]|nr:D-sedoheptulose 7-phosphate isomerase [Flavobacteriales bacterium]